jgi:hypothetical protein
MLSNVRGSNQTQGHVNPRKIAFLKIIICFSFLFTWLHGFFDRVSVSLMDVYMMRCLLCGHTGRKQMQKMLLHIVINKACNV